MQLKRSQLFVDGDAAVTEAHTMENTEISPNIPVWKLCFSVKFLHQEIR